MGWLEILRTINSTATKKELRKQTKLMRRNIQQQNATPSAAWYAGWAACNNEWIRRGHRPEGCK